MISFFKKSHKFFFVVEHTNILQKSNINKLKWLFDNSELIKSKTIKGDLLKDMGIIATRGAIKKKKTTQQNKI